MTSGMVIQMTQCGKFHSTAFHLALKRPFASVDSDVGIQIPLFREGL
jgi:hypothetical protein